MQLLSTIWVGCRVHFKCIQRHPRLHRASSSGCLACVRARARARAVAALLRSCCTVARAPTTADPSRHHTTGCLLLAAGVAAQSVAANASSAAADAAEAQQDECDAADGCDAAVAEQQPTTAEAAARAALLRSRGVIRTPPLADAETLAALPPGTVLIAPSLVLIPAGPRAAVPPRAAALLFPRGATRHTLPGSCARGNGGSGGGSSSSSSSSSSSNGAAAAKEGAVVAPLRRRDLAGLLPPYVAEALPRGVCLPAGQLWVSAFFLPAAGRVLGTPMNNMTARPWTSPTSSTLLPTPFRHSSVRRRAPGLCAPPGARLAQRHRPRAARHRRAAAGRRRRSGAEGAWGCRGTERAARRRRRRRRRPGRRRQRATQVVGHPWPGA